jgi:hypothetical protein
VVNKNGKPFMVNQKKRKHSIIFFRNQVKKAILRKIKGSIMPKIKYAIETGGSKRLEISWKGNFTEFTIRLDGNLIGSINNREQLEAGQEFRLEDGSSIKVQLPHRSIFSYPQVSINSQPLHPSGLEPAKRLSNVYKLIFIFAGANLAAGIILLSHTGLQKSLAVGLRSLVAGGLFFLLAFFVIRRSIIALSIFVGILAVDLILSVIFPPELPRFILIAAVVFRIFILLAIIQGFGAIKALKQNQPMADKSPG